MAISESGVRAPKNVEEEPNPGQEKSSHLQKIMELLVEKKELVKHGIAMFMRVQVNILRIYLELY